MQLFAWYNLFFLAPIVVAFVLLLLTALGGLDHGDASADTDVDAGVDGHFDVDMDHDIGDGQDGGGHDGDGHDSGQQGFSAILRDAFGLGKIPITVHITIFMMLIGTFGLCANIIQGEMLKIKPEVYFSTSMIIAVVGSILLTRMLIPLASRCIPREETQLITPYDFVGKTGIAREQIDEISGRIQANDKYGSLHTLYARTKGEQVPANKEVLIESFVKEGDYYVVSTFDEGA